MTVQGPVDVSELGFTLPHEHLHCDTRLYCTGGGESSAAVEEIPAGALRAAPLRYPDNLDMRHEPTARAELNRYAEAGGRTLVELTTTGLSPDWGTLRRLSEATGVRVIAGTGFYVQESHPPELASFDADAIAETMISAVERGDSAGIRAGVIGEIGTSDPLQPDEAKVVAAAGTAHLATGCPVNLHLIAGLREVFRLFDILSAAGVSDLSKIVISHCDDVLDVDVHRRIALAGAIVEYDTFGNEGFPNQSGNLMPSDVQRLRAVAQLLDWGLGDQLLLSHDVCMKSLWCAYGGYGYTGLPARLVPAMDHLGIGAAQRRQLFVDNPGRVFGFLPDSIGRGEV